VRAASSDTIAVMKLGEMLVRDGRLTEEQLEQGLAHQKHSGGRLGTVLVELGLIDLDALTVYLGLELGIPIASGAMLERAKRSAVRLLTPDQAFRFKCVPLIVQDRQLIAAVEDPHDFDTLDTLAYLTGYRVIPRIAPEIRIYYYVERYYGMARPARYFIFGDGPRGDQPLDAGLPAPPLPGLPPMAVAPTPAPGPAPALRRLAQGTEAAFDADTEALELEAEDLLEELDADVGHRAETAPHVAQPDPDNPVTPLPTAPAEPAPESYQPISVDAAVAAMQDATDRAGVADAILAFTTGLFDTSVLFMVKDHLALGWKGAGSGVSRERVECLLIPLDAPSMFQAALGSGDGVFHGAPAPSTVHAYLYKVLRCPEPAVASAAAISIGKRVVNVLCGHRAGRADLDEREVEDLRRVTRAAAEAYARIAVWKRRR
jgi:MshEN domain